MPITKEILDMLALGRKPSQVILVALFRSKIAKITKDKCSHCAMDLDYCFRWLSTAPSHRIITLWVHPLTLTSLLLILRTVIRQGKPRFIKCPHNFLKMLLHAIACAHNQTLVTNSLNKICNALFVSNLADVISLPAVSQ